MAKKLPPANDWQARNIVSKKTTGYLMDTNRPRPTKAVKDEETIWEFVYRCYKEGKFKYSNGLIYKCYDFRGKGSWMDRPRELGSKASNGYTSVNIRFNGHFYRTSAHRIIYVFFNGPKVFEDGKVINHINGDKSDNRIENLELVTQSENIRHSLEEGLRKVENTNTAKLSWEKVREIRNKYSTGKYTQKQLAKDYGVNQTTISSIILNKTWKEVG